MPGGTLTKKVHVTYEKGAGDAGGLQVWTYFFDEKTGRLAANHLNYAPDKYDFTESFYDRTFDGIQLAARRVGLQRRRPRKDRPETFGDALRRSALERLAAGVAFPAPRGKMRA